METEQLNPATPTVASPNIHSRMGSVEARMQSVESRLDKHEVQISALEKGDAAMLAKLSENDSRWVTVQEQLKVVEQIQDIQRTMTSIGKLFIGAARAIKWLITMTAIVCGIYAAIHTGDLTSLSTFISQLIGLQ